jgi:hypothetical protein
MEKVFLRLEPQQRRARPLVMKLGQRSGWTVSDLVFVAASRESNEGRYVPGGQKTLAVRFLQGSGGSSFRTSRLDSRQRLERLGKKRIDKIVPRHRLCK